MNEASPQVNPETSRYFVPQPSHWPVVGSTALLLMASGLVVLLNAARTAGLIMIGLGFLTLFFMMWGWFGRVIGESEGNRYNRQVDLSFRWGMSWFIFSEVMFFAAFFGALFYVRVLSVPWLGDIDNSLIWPAFKPQWPTAGPGLPQDFTPMRAWGIPAINTLCLLSSGATVTWAHWGLKKGDRNQLILGLVLTILLGVTFLGLQANEYGHAAFGLNTGVYGATFFMLTGFHGFHVTMGTIMLIVILLRCIAGHFRPEHHFAFEAVSWYWHFVDVVWLLLFVFVYWL
jgi:cytochrome c oxidase subunit III